MQGHEDLGRSADDRHPVPRADAEGDRGRNCREFVENGARVPRVVTLEVDVTAEDHLVEEARTDRADCRADCVAVEGVGSGSRETPHRRPPRVFPRCETGQWLRLPDPDVRRFRRVEGHQSTEHVMRTLLKEEARAVELSQDEVLSVGELEALGRRGP
jgi:hypothetical protein